jgi:hypothetical protein
MFWTSDPKSVERFFIAVWVLLFVAGLIFSRTASPATKQKWQTPMAVCVGLTFLGFATWIGGRSNFLFLALPGGGDNLAQQPHHSLLPAMWSDGPQSLHLSVAEILPEVRRFFG